MTPAMGRSLLWGLAAVALTACGPSGRSADGGTDGGASCDLSTCNLAAATNAAPLTDAADGGDFQCAYPGLIEYAPCVSEGDGQLRVTFLCTDPPSPVQGINHFTVAVTDGSGTPVPNLPLSVNLWMPLHCHGPQYQPSVDGGADGVYQIDGAYLFMAGEWQITFSVDGGYQGSCPPGPTPSQTFYFCVGG
ncbi:MAG: FixH family protein [Myxococcales bacterium]